MERIKNRDKLLKKYKKSKLEVDRHIYREAKIVASKLIKSKKVTILNKRLWNVLVTVKTLENSAFSWHALKKRIGLLCLPGKEWQ